MYAFTSLLLLLQLVHALALVPYHISESCTRSSPLYKNSISDDQHVRQLSETSDYTPELPSTVAESRNKGAQTDLSLYKRRVPSRPSGSIPASIKNRPAPTYTFRFYRFEFAISSKESEDRPAPSVASALEYLYQGLAVLILGLEIQPQLRMRLRVGVLTLDFYAVVEYLSKEVVLAVVRKLSGMAMMGLGVLPAGEVLDLNAGIRALFAVGVHLNGIVELIG